MAGEEGTEKRPARGRYLAEYVRVTEADPAVQPQQELDAKEGKEWHLVGVSGGLKEGEVVLFWDTARPTCGRTGRVC